MGKAIRVYRNKEYIYTTNKFNTCKEAVKDCKSKDKIIVRGELWPGEY